MTSPSLVFILLVFMALSTASAFSMKNGEGEQEEEAVMFVNVRSLLGLKGSKGKSSISPSPSSHPTMESATPSRSSSFTDPPVTQPSQFPSHPLNHKPPSLDGKRKKETNNENRNKRLLVAVLITSVTALLVCLMGVLWFVFGKMKLHKKTMRRKRDSTRALLGVNPELDFLYLESLGWDIHQKNKGPKQTTETSNTVFVAKHASENIPRRNDQAGDKAPVHDEVELDSDHDKLVGMNSSDVDETAGPGDNSSDDETFVSLADDSHLSIGSLSNVSAASITSFPSSVNRFPPPPPPPPLPPPRESFRAPTTSSLSRRHGPQLSNFSSVTLPRPSKPSHGFSGNVQPPPLPPQVSSAMEEAPLPKLRPLHWDKVKSTAERSMVWDKIRSNSFELDEEMIESLFGYKNQSPMKIEETTGKSSSLDKRVLDPKRLQNITILLKAVNASTEQVCESLIRGNGLSQAQLEALARMAPTMEEEAKLSRCAESMNELVSAEKFIKALLGIPFAFMRVEAMLFRETFEDEVVHLRNSFSMLEEACKELKSSRLFLKLLQAVLKTGNRMNNGTIRGGAKAFRLDALLKLADIRGADGKTTLLHFVVQEIIRSEGIQVSDSIMGKISQKCNSSPQKGYPYISSSKTVDEKEEDYKRTGLELVCGLSTEMHNVKKTATVDMELLASSVSNLAEGIEKVKGLANEELVAKDEKNERFVATMKAFSGQAERSLKVLREDERRVSVCLGEVTEYFHGDNVCKVEEPLRIFVIVRDFLGMLEQVCKEIRTSKFPSGPSQLAPFR